MLHNRRIATYTDDLELHSNRIHPERHFPSIYFWSPYHPYHHLQFLSVRFLLLSIEPLNNRKIKRRKNYQKKTKASLRLYYIYLYLWILWHVHCFTSSWHTATQALNIPKEPYSPQPSEKYMCVCVYILS